MSPDRLLNWASATVGTREGSGRQRRWAAAAGISATTAWCSAWISYGLQKMGIRPPINPAYSGSWLQWKNGETIWQGSRGGANLSAAHPGDLLIFDWGDGGITDHVALYTGNGQMIAGNNSDNSVGKSPVPTGSIVGIVRPKAFKDGGNGEGSGLNQTLEGIPGFGALANAYNDVVAEPLLDVLGFGADKAKDTAAGAAKDALNLLFDLLGVNAAAIALNVALVGGGAFLVYYGVAKMAGVDQPAKQFYSRTPAGAALAGAAS